MNPSSNCTLCPRLCGANRQTGVGFCGAGPTLKVARAALHQGEEPCISGKTGSGTVFFSGCCLQCCYCQNYPISQQGVGKEISLERLSEIFLQLQRQGAANINLVTATQWLPWVLPALDAAKANGLTLPVVYNTSGYERVSTIQALQKYVDVWLVDVKYVSSDVSAEYSGAPDYFKVCSAAVDQMLRQTPRLVYKGDELQKGTVVRHLALPGAMKDSLAVLDYLASLPTDRFLFSLMSQYTPFFKAAEHKHLNRRLSSWEYRTIVNHAVDLGLTQGYTQQRSSAGAQYTPPFDLEGV